MCSFYENIYNKRVKKNSKAKVLMECIHLCCLVKSVYTSLNRKAAFIEQGKQLQKKKSRLFGKRDKSLWKC